MEMVFTRAIFHFHVSESECMPEVKERVNGGDPPMVNGVQAQIHRELELRCCFFVCVVSSVLHLSLNYP